VTTSRRIVTLPVIVTTCDPPPVLAVDTATLAKIASLTSKYSKDAAKAATKGKSKASAKASSSSSSSSSSSDAAEISAAAGGDAMDAVAAGMGLGADADENADVSECMSLEQVTRGGPKIFCTVPLAALVSY
jgi:hypothetical protein